MSFVYELEIDGEAIEFELKPIEEIPMGIAVLNEYDGDEQAQARDMLRWALSDEQFELLKDAPVTAGMKMVEAWQKGESGMDLGKSVASSGSSTSSARRSKQTS